MKLHAVGVDGKDSGMMVSRAVGVSALLAVALAASAAYADSPERGIGRPAGGGAGLLRMLVPQGAGEQPEAQAQPSQVDDKTINVSQPDADVAAEAPEEAKPVRKQRRKARKADDKPARAEASSRKRPAATANARPAKAEKRLGDAEWWEKKGNPVVFAFRDCIAADAAEKVAKNASDLRALVAGSMQGRCREDFDNMSDVLTARLGKQRFAEIAVELTNSTFVPAVRQAVAEAKGSLPAPAAAPGVAPQAAPVVEAAAQPAPAQASAADGEDAVMKRAKDQMFDCYRASADHQARASHDPLDQATDNVLIECGPLTNAFFDRLFELYPLSPQARAERIRSAIDGSYRPAIAQRIQTRRSGLAGQTGYSQSSVGAQ